MSGSLINVTDRLAQALGAVATEHTRTAIARAESGAQAITLLLACPSLCAVSVSASTPPEVSRKCIP